MMPKRSAGILLYRGKGNEREVFLVHPGGPYWAKKDVGTWSVPKGLVDTDEDPLAAARREFREETGFTAEGAFRDLGTFLQPSGKALLVWAVEGNCNPERLVSNLFEMVWPPKSGRLQSFPEVDRGAWFGGGDALIKILKGQRPIIEQFFTCSRRL